MGDQPSRFRLYLFDGRRERGEHTTRVVAIRSTVEAAAIREADDLRKGKYAELWRGEKVVRIFDPG